MILTISIFVEFFLVGVFTSTKGRFCRSRSSKVDMFGANRKRGVNFLLVRNSNFGPILHSFGDLIGFMCPDSTLILGVFPLHQITHVGPQPEQRP